MLDDGHMYLLNVTVFCYHSQVPSVSKKNPKTASSLEFPVCIKTMSSFNKNKHVTYLKLWNKSAQIKISWIP